MKLAKEKREIDNAEQYALFAITPGWYECYTCPSRTIYLFTGDIWKYRVTRKGKTVRYSFASLGDKNLQYITQFVGNYAECLIQEKIKIYHYPLLPDNLKRPDSLRLVYPPGNKQDN